ncbi:MAG: hypothetical protein VX498_00125 [Myxococcota bacterium]|nr:hypothetical protein [Myxococcota bacterium]
MRLVFSSLLLALLLACDPLTVPSGYDPGGVDCQNNSAPAIVEDDGEGVSEVQVDSSQPVGNPNYVLVIGFRWEDPGSATGATDPPNLVGGEFTAEISGVAVPDIALTESVLEAGCTEPSDGLLVAHCQDVSVGSGCPAGGAAGCAVASLAVPLQLVPSGNSGTPFVQGDEIDISFRIRDACGMTSNELSGPHLLE